MGLLPLPVLHAPPPPTFTTSMEMRWVRGGSASKSSGQVIELNTICFQSPQSPSMLGKKGGGWETTIKFPSSHKNGCNLFFLAFQLHRCLSPAVCSNMERSLSCRFSSHI